MESQETVVEPQTEEEYFADVEQKILSGELKLEESPDESQPSEESPKTESKEDGTESDDDTEGESTEDVDDVLPTAEGPAIKENKRLRENKRELSQELEDLKAKVSRLEAPKDDPKDDDPVLKKIKSSSIEELLKAENNVDNMLYKARVDEDEDRLAQLSDMKVKLKKELLERPGQDQASANELKSAEKEWSALEAEVTKAHPSLLKQDSQLQKDIKAFVDNNSHLMKHLGSDVGGMLALGMVLSGQKASPKSKQGEHKQQPSLVDEMEKIAGYSTPKTPSAKSSGDETKGVNVNQLTDEQMDDIAFKIKSGDMKLSDLG